MDHNRVEGSLKQAGATIKQVFGRVTGDAKFQAEGRAQNVEGKIQNAMGGAKDAYRDQKYRADQ